MANLAQDKSQTSLKSLSLGKARYSIGRKANSFYKIKFIDSILHNQSL